MGSGIAQLAARSGAQTFLHDPVPEALERGLARAREGFQREVARGRLSAEAAQGAAQRLEPVGDLDAFAPCELVIEAVPERLELKHELYTRLSEIVSERCVLASNTSSLLVTAIAAAASDPSRVVGMHFFNPAPVMALLEVVAGEESSPEALALADATGEAMGKTVIRATDGPASSSTAATVRSGSRRCACCRSGSPTWRRSTASAAWRAPFGWDRSS